YWRLFAELIHVWSIDPNYSHGFVVFGAGIVFALLAGVGVPGGKRFHLPDLASGRQTLAGLLWMLVGFLVGMAGGFVGHLFLGVVSLIFVLCGAIRLVGGEEAKSRFGFAAMFLIFMAPLPMAWYQPAAVTLQAVASSLSAGVLEAFGATVFREGHQIQLPGYTLEVGQACSGLRALTAVLALAVAVGHFSGRTWWYAWVLALAAVPIAVAANCLRVVLTALIMMALGPQWAEGVYHTAEGLVVIALAAVLLLAAAAGLTHIEGRFLAAGNANQKPMAPTRSRSEVSEACTTGRGVRLRARLALCILTLALAWGGLETGRNWLEAAGPLPAVPLARPLAELPLVLGPWRGNDEPLRDQRLLYADEHLQRTYRHVERSQALSVWLVYSREGADRGHHPEVCMRVAGKPEDVPARRELAVDGGKAPIQRYRFGRPGDYQWVFYWHYTLPPGEDSGVHRLQRLYQRLRKRPSSLTIEVFAPEYSPDDVRYVEEFVRQLDETIRPLVGPDGVRGSRRLPVTVLEGVEPPDATKGL
ncbi:MAG: exosortase, partial [Thermoguttaceae bacterium]|nr:exosortase [Thermoguttaceae bacterium]